MDMTNYKEDYKGFEITYTGREWKATDGETQLIAVQLTQMREKIDERQKKLAKGKQEPILFMDFSELNLGIGRYRARKTTSRPDRRYWRTSSMVYVADGAQDRVECAQQTDLFGVPGSFYRLGTPETCKEQLARLHELARQMQALDQERKVIIQTIPLADRALFEAMEVI